MIKGLKSNKLEDIWWWFVNELSSKYNVNEAKAIGYNLFEFYFGINYADFFLRKDQRFGESAIVSLYKAILKLKKDTPVQYITGISFFRELKLNVSPHVLIPRPETEELAGWVKDDICRKEGYPSIEIALWDIGTGSGAIALSLATELKEIRVWASDISSAALSMAAANALNNNAKVSFFQHDILHDPPPNIQIDCIISNPPYVRNSEKSLMLKNVVDHEPSLALFVTDDNPLIFYEAIASAAKRVLKPGGFVYVEINESLASETGNVFSENGFVNVEVRNDINDKPRFIRSQFL